MGVRSLDLERYVLKFKTVSEFAKFLGLSLDEAKIKLVENNVKPSEINKDRFFELKKKKSMAQIAKYYQVPLSTLNKVCAEQKVNKKLSNISRADLLKDAFEGKTIVEIANKYGVSYTTMQKFLSANKVVTKSKKRMLNKKVIASLMKQKLSISEIARRMNCTIPAIMYYVKGR